MNAFKTGRYSKRLTALRAALDAMPKTTDTLVQITGRDRRRMEMLAHGLQSVGEKSVTWDGTNDAGFQVGSGIYFYRLQAGSDTSVRKMLLMK